MFSHYKKLYLERETPYSRLQLYCFTKSKAFKIGNAFLFFLISSFFLPYMIELVQ